LRREVKKDIKITYNTFMSNSENNISNDPGQLWKFIKNKTSPQNVLKFEGQIV